ncbi:ribonuclease HII [Clostridium isatidis]|uniref:Ribonuclease HII n=1 Tax=Clostridium isatidis TaxID=182773 RepID=A0A343JBM7_9CLOT|nr:ribonuclease HII [Clostridium isatidis]ASW42935.1 ribonuclease HII [Clostridium isatidis]NLZ34838.1 ribonuclease HII [Clostridiales bacterium]
MSLSNINLEELSYKKVKEYIDKIDINKEKNNQELEKLIDLLINDKRKNINLLGNKLIKEKEKIEKEINRVKLMYDFDKTLGNFKYIAGVDEVGRGPLAGPIVACAVILDLNVLEEDLILDLKDSKKLSSKKREELSNIIKEKALAYYIAESSNEEIDKKGIAYCNNKVFLEACTSMKIKPDLVLSDGYKVRGIDIPNKAVIKGDAKSASIAAASIVAKVYRDNLMKEYAKKYPYYDFEENAGYGTKKHIEAIKEKGICIIHRKSFLNNILNKL